MPYLVRPNIRYHFSYLNALDEYQDESLDAGPPTFLLRDKNLFGKYLADILAQADYPKSDEKTHSSFIMWWWVEGDQYLGRISLRLYLNDYLELYGGHVGYDVRVSERGKGHATAMLSSVLSMAKALGYKELLIVCEENNVSSRKVIEKNGGHLLGMVKDENLITHLRFTVMTDHNT